MQTSGHQSPALNDEVSSTFAERAKSARLRAGLTQQQLSDRLRDEAEVVLDTSAITRIEAGQREPRLGEALAIARALGFGLNNLVPRADLDFYLSDVERLMDESRAALVKMVRAVDPVVDFVRRNPDCLGDDRLEDRFREAFEWFHQRVSHQDLGHEDEQTFAITTNRSDEKLKRQLLRAVSEGILVRPDEIQPAYDRWFKEDVGEDRRGASTTGQTRQGWQRVESRARAEQWEKHFSAAPELRPPSRRRPGSALLHHPRRRPARRLGHRPTQPLHARHARSRSLNAARRVAGLDLGPTSQAAQRENHDTESNMNSDPTTRTSKSDDCHFPTLAHVWDHQTRAIIAGADNLEALSAADRTRSWLAFS